MRTGSPRILAHRARAAVVAVLVSGCVHNAPIAPLWAELEPLTPPTVAPIADPLGCPLEASPRVVDGCAFALVPAARALETEQRLTIGDWYAERARICQQYRAIDRAFASDVVERQAADIAAGRRENAALRWSVAAAGIGGIVVGVASSALAVWLLSESEPK